MSQPIHTPAWGTPTDAVHATGTNAETQLLPPVAQVQPKPTREMVELRGTALYYATRILGSQPTLNPDSALATTLRVAQGVEQYLLTGKTGV